MDTMREWRKKKKWTQAELARRIGSDKFQVCRWERGKHQPSRMARMALKRVGCELVE